MTVTLPFQVGFNARLFPNIWRPARDEIAFAKAHDFQALQFRRDNAAIDEKQLGDSFSVMAEVVRGADLVVTIELVLHVNGHGETPLGQTPLEILEANLPAIQSFDCHFVHWHLVPTPDLKGSDILKLENILTSYFMTGAAYAREHDFQLGFEHNEPDLMLFSTPESCHRLLSRVPDLRFVWDFNHTILEHLPGFFELIPHMRVIHVSDTPLPKVNHHLPLGLGTVDYPEYSRVLLEGGFSGPAILEIGGLAKSGGTGRDTDETLVDSYRRFRKAVELHMC
jgi:L-ribulose-5-phosphate 3-epimerase